MQFQIELSLAIPGNGPKGNNFVPLWCTCGVCITKKTNIRGSGCFCCRGTNLSANFIIWDIWGSLSVYVFVLYPLPHATIQSFVQTSQAGTRDPKSAHLVACNVSKVKRHGSALCQQLGCIFLKGVKVDPKCPG